MAIERSQKREATVGLIAISVLIFSFLMIFFLADLRRLFTPTATLYVLMPSAAGLRATSEVWVAGKTVGEVKEIEVRPPNIDTLQRVAVRVSVAERDLEHIRQDSKARITSFRMIGDAVLDISPGSAALPGIKANDTLRMRMSGTPAAAIERALSLKESLQDLVAESRSLGTRARDRTAQAASMSRQVMATAHELEAFTKALDEGPLMNTFSDPEFKSIVNSLSASMEELRNSFARAADRAKKARSDAEPSLRRLTARADTISAQIALLQTAIANGGGGLLVRVQTDSAIFRALHDAQEQMDSLIAETKRKPWRFWL
jgi:ABC-type transporter Mla subunit MlaD